MIKYEDNLAARLNGNNLQPLAGASVSVSFTDTGAPATIYADDGVTVRPQPLTTDNNGYFGFKAPDGKYTLTISGVRFATFTRQIVLDDPDENPYATVQALAADDGAGKVGYGDRKVADKLAEVVSVEDAPFNAKGNNAHDDMAAINAAILAAGNGGTVHLVTGKTYRASGPIVFPPNSSRITLEGNGATIRADHNGDGIVLTSQNENYGGHVLRNLTIQGPNVAYPMSAAELEGTSVGAGVRMGGDDTNAASAFSNEFHNVNVQGFRQGWYLQAALWCKWFGGYTRFNREGIVIDSGQANANNWYGHVVRLNRHRGLYSTGKQGGALTRATANVFHGGGFESNIPYRGDLAGTPGWSVGGYPDAMDTSGAGVAVFLSDSYDFVFDSAYFENHNYSIWLNGSSDNNSFKHCRLDGNGTGVRIGGVLIDSIGTSLNTFERCTKVCQSANEVNVETFNGNQQHNQFLDCEGFNFITANLASIPYVRNNRPHQSGGGTPVGTIAAPDHGLLSNPGEGAVTGSIQGIGTATATLHAFGYAEIEFGNQITGGTTITSIKGVRPGQFLVLYNYQPTHKVIIKSATSDTGLLLLKHKRDAVLDKYGQTLTLWCNRQGKLVEVGRNFSNRKFGDALVSGTSTSVVVTFDTPEPDNNYRPVICAGDVSGSPAAGALTARAGLQSEKGFTITLSAAPGAGAGIYYTWEAVR